ncbi:MAG: outer membrane protein transport protein, partial [Haloferula sp.]
MKPIQQAVIATLGLTTLAHGAGYQLQERSTRGLGRAFSGEAAIADDASVMASNPAGMLLVPGDTAISVGLSGIFPDVDVQGVFTPTGAPGGIPTTA